jgi:hypothetical protein
MLRPRILLPFEIGVFFRDKPTKWELVGDVFVGTEFGPPRPGSPELSAARDRFLRAKTDRDFLDWLNSTGQLHPELMSISRTELRRLQHVVETRLTDDPRTWYDFFKDQPLSEDPMFALFDKSGLVLKLLIDHSLDTGEPFGTIEAETTLEGMAASVVLERGSGGTKYARCAFENCQRMRVFKVGNQPNQLYCSHECARADGQRRRRAQKKLATAK